MTSNKHNIVFPMCFFLMEKLIHIFTPKELSNWLCANTNINILTRGVSDGITIHLNGNKKITHEN